MEDLYKIFEEKFYFEITEFCNFHCPFCFNQNENSFKNSIRLEDFKTIVSIINSHGCKKILLTGGEPLTHKDIWPIVEFLDTLNFQVKILTNGYYLNDRWIDYFLKSPKHILQISMDGANKETHNFYRGKGSFEKNMEIINALFSSGYKNGILRMTITQLNYHQVTDFLKLALEKNFTPDLSFVQNSGIAKKYWEELKLSPEECLYVIKEIQDLKKEYPEKKLDFINLFPITNCRILDNPPVLKPVITANGDVLPCNMMRTVIGNLLVNDYEQIFNSGLSKTSKKLNQLKSQKKKMCALFVR